MSLVGFEHVFARAVISFAPDVRFKVAPPPVVALLKIVAYTEDPYRRQKDLDDLRSLLRHYETGSDRMFGDDVFAAELEDIEYTNAFLLGLDVGAIAVSTGCPQGNSRSWIKTTSNRETRYAFTCN